MGNNALPPNATKLNTKKGGGISVGGVFLFILIVGGIITGIVFAVKHFKDKKDAEEETTVTEEEETTVTEEEEEAPVSDASTEDSGARGTQLSDIDSETDAALRAMPTDTADEQAAALAARETARQTANARQTATDEADALDTGPTDTPAIVGYTFSIKKGYTIAADSINNSPYPSWHVPLSRATAINQPPDGITISSNAAHSVNMTKLQNYCNTECSANETCKGYYIDGISAFTIPSTGTPCMPNQFASYMPNPAKAMADYYISQGCTAAGVRQNTTGVANRASYNCRLLNNSDTGSRARPATETIVYNPETGIGPGGSPGMNLLDAIYEKKPI